MIASITAATSTGAFCDENDEDVEISRIGPQERAECVTVVVASDGESGHDKRCARTKIPRTVSFDEENNATFEIPRINEMFKAKCWLTKEEHEHNLMMNRIRYMVRKKLIVLMAKSEDFFESADEIDETESETETESEFEDDLLEGFGGEGHVQNKQQKEQLVTRKQKCMARKDRIREHLLDAIMERRNQDIHSFLTSKCSINFTRKPKKK